MLNQLGVVCYYTFSVKGFEENNAVFTPNSRSVQEQREEKRFGKLTKEDAHNPWQSLRNAAKSRLPVLKSKLPSGCSWSFQKT